MGACSRDAAELFRRVEGAFFRCVLADRVDDVLKPPAPTSAGRYHRLGQPTLYLSPKVEWATTAVSGYMREDEKARVVVPVAVSAAFVLDQRDEESCRRLGIDREHSDANWRAALANGMEPPSWRNADAARAAGAAGIIDRSRLIPDGWHLNLFRWNAAGGPSVRVTGEPAEVRLSKSGLKWGL